jgi:hypothetical protein
LLDENNNDLEVEDINPEKANKNKRLMVKSNQEQALDSELTREKLIQVFHFSNLIGFNLHYRLIFITTQLKFPEAKRRC